MNPAPQPPPGPNTPARKTVDPRMHSAEHILTATLIKMLGCGRPITTHIEKKKSKADYTFDRWLTPEEVAEVERRVNELVAADVTVQEEFLARPAAAARFNLERLPEHAGPTVRIVSIGEYDACPCIGPHVKSTREIGQFKIISTSWENGALRVRFKLEP